MSPKNLNVSSKTHKLLLNKLKDDRTFKIYKKFEDYLNINENFIVAGSGGADSLALSFLAKIYSIKKSLRDPSICPRYAKAKPLIISPNNENKEKLYPAIADVANSSETFPKKIFTKIPVIANAENIFISYGIFFAIVLLIDGEFSGLFKDLSILINKHIIIFNIKKKDI